MKPTIGIVTDSTGDIPVEEAARLGIHVVPAIVTIEGETFVDGQGLSRQEFYRRLPEMHDPPTTAAPSIAPKPVKPRSLARSATRARLWRSPSTASRWITQTTWTT